ncbi:MAG: hypothetical protein HC902_03045 [Calothrix sp. SM1_5_4]|nr:hypothetical protein [Calothrix sp. SM1_5_4]
MTSTSIRPNKDFLKNLQYVILPGRLELGSPWTDLQNRAYSYWVEFWNGVFKANKVEAPVNFKPAFFRMSAITVLLFENQIIGMHMYCFFNLEQLSHRDHEYFQSERGSRFIEILQKHGVSRIMSMEFLTVDPNWRKGSVGISLGAVLSSLGSRIQRAAGLEAATTIARKDLGVDAFARDFGFENVTEGLNMYNTPVVFQCLFTDKIRDLPDTDTRSYVDLYWRNRVDASGLTLTPVRSERQSAAA